MLVIEMGNIYATIFACVNCLLDMGNGGTANVYINVTHPVPRFVNHERMHVIRRTFCVRMNRLDTFDPYRIQCPKANVLIRHLWRIRRDIMSTREEQTKAGCVVKVMLSVATST